MTDSTPAQLVEHLENTNTVAIITTRKDGTEVATPIWSMVVDGVPYLRSVDGPDAAWYRRATSGRPVAFSLADGRIAESDRDAALATPRTPVKLTRVGDDDPVHPQIDAVLHRKYRREPTSVAPMVVEPALSATVRVDQA